MAGGVMQSVAAVASRNQCDFQLRPNGKTWMLADGYVRAAARWSTGSVCFAVERMERISAPTKTPVDRTGTGQGAGVKSPAQDGSQRTTMTVTVGSIAESPDRQTVPRRSDRETPRLRACCRPL
jgi:hypothetical protein